MLLIQARSHTNLGQKDEASPCLKKALLIGERDGFVRSFVDEGPGLLSLLRTSAIQGQFSSYVKRFLEAVGQELTNQSPYDPLTE